MYLTQSLGSSSFRTSYQSGQSSLISLQSKKQLTAAAAPENGGTPGSEKQPAPKPRKRGRSEKKTFETILDNNAKEVTRIYSQEPELNINGVSLVKRCF